MSLDLTKVASQVAGMVSRLKAGREERQKRLDYALAVIHNRSSDIDSLRRKILSSRTTWLVAGLVDGLDRHYEASPPPDEFTVVSTDGSHIDVDRHQTARCYLINISSVVIHYGDCPDAILDSHPYLYTRDDELVITPVGRSGREQPIEGTLLGIKRSVEECRRLAELAKELPSNSPILALLDGTLIIWGLEAYPEFVTEALLDNGFLKYLDGLKESSSKHRLALASFISFPRSTDVVNALRVALCPNDPLDTDRHCKDCEKRECVDVAGVRDRDLFALILGQGERSAIFSSQSSIIEKRYGIHRVYFFYIKTGDEVARVEIPEWVARDEEMLNLVHTLVLDQCQRGHGYPVALSEAHEKAVITGADRENFWALVESSMVEEQIPTLTSAKSRSKKTRWV